MDIPTLFVMAMLNIHTGAVVDKPVTLKTFPTVDACVEELGEGKGHFGKPKDGKVPIYGCVPTKSAQRSDRGSL